MTGGTPIATEHGACWYGLQRDIALLPLGDIPGFNRVVRIIAQGTGAQ